MKNKHLNIEDIWWAVEAELNGCTTHPHNFYIQLLSETGLVGFFTIFSIFIYLILLFIIL